MEEFNECLSCGEDDMDTCPQSRRKCGHHCNHIWTAEECDWCGLVLTPDESGEAEVPQAEKTP
jgi:hypothetical protein